MSELIRLLNSIKIQRSSSWLTPSQRGALTTIHGILRIPQIVNLCGPIGSGKTFLAWQLADELNYEYLSHPSLLQQTDLLAVKGLVIDNCRHDRQFHRDVLKMLQMDRVLRSIIVTRQPIRDYVRYVELGLSSSDQSKVCENLLTIGCFREPGVSDLWQLVNPYLVSLRDQAELDQSDDRLLFTAA